MKDVVPVKTEENVTLTLANITLNIKGGSIAVYKVFGYAFRTKCGKFVELENRYHDVVMRVPIELVEDLIIDFDD